MSGANASDQNLSLSRIRDFPHDRCNGFAVRWAMRALTARVKHSHHRPDT